MINKLINFSFLLILICIPLLIVSCEDDAILTPINESECTGSYCNLSLPNSQVKNNYENPKIF